MYEEVIRALREHSKPYGSECVNCPYIGAGKRGYNMCSEEMAEKAADAIEELQRKLMVAEDESGLYDALPLVYQPKPVWISTEDLLPDQGEYVLVRFGNGDVCVACLFDRDEHMTFWRAMVDESWTADCDTEPSYWMPLPEVPKQEANDGD